MGPIKKLIFSTLFVWVGIICFASCASKVNSPVPEVTCNDGSTCPIPTVRIEPQPRLRMIPPPVTISDDNWEFVLPSEGWLPVVQAPASISRALVNKDKQNLIVFVKEPFKGNMMEYSIISLRDIKDAGAQLIAFKNVEINKQKFFMLETISASGHSKIWMWLTFDKGFGYMFSCGGPLADAERQTSLCEEIINSFKLTK